MADHGYPQDVKVNMTEDDSNAAPPPFSVENEAAVPLLGDEKKQDHLSVDEETTQPRGRCSFRDRFRRGRCTSEQRAQRKTKARKFFRRFFRRLFMAFFLVWAYFAFFSSDDESDWSSVPEENQFPSEGLQPWTPFSPFSAENQASLVFAPVEDIMDDTCTHDLVKWEGPEFIETNLLNIRLGFGKGNLLSNVIIRSGEVEVPTLLIRANVTKVEQAEDDDEDDDDDDNDDDEDRERDPKGLHLNLKESEEALEISFWADKYVPRGKGDNDEDRPPRHPRKHPHHRHRHHKHHHKGGHRHHHKHHHKHGRKHHDHDHDRDGGEDEPMFSIMKRDEDDDHPRRGGHGRYQRYCAIIEVEILLPANDENLYSIAVGGIILSAKAEDLEGVSFKELLVGSVLGEIKAGDITADRLVAEVVTGAVSVESLQVATEGKPLHARVRSAVGNLSLNAKTGPITVHREDDDDEEDGGEEGEVRICGEGEGDGEDDGEDDGEGKKKRRLNHHLVLVNTVAGAVDLDIAVTDNDRDEEKETIPGTVVVRATSSSGRVHSSIDLTEGQKLLFKSSSTKGKVVAKVSDRFLGELTVASFLGTAEVIEAKKSESTIEYEKKTSHAKVGRKFVDDGNDDDDNDDGNEGEDDGEVKHPRKHREIKGVIEIGTGLGDAKLEFL